MGASGGAATAWAEGWREAIAKTGPVILSEAKDPAPYFQVSPWSPSTPARHLMYVYILANVYKTICTGVTNDLERRLWEHRSGLWGGFTTPYETRRVVYFEATDSIVGVIAREKQIKGWMRWKKVALIESANPEWRDLSVAWDLARDSSLHSE